MSKAYKKRFIKFAGSITLNSLDIAVTQIGKNTIRLQLQRDSQPWEQKEFKNYVDITLQTWMDLPEDPCESFVEFSAAWDLIKGDGNFYATFKMKKLVGPKKWAPYP